MERHRIDADKHIDFKTRIIPADRRPVGLQEEPVTSLPRAGEVKLDDHPPIGQAILQESGSFSVSVFRRGQHEVARRFARPGRPTELMALTGLSLVHRNPRLPILADALAWLNCRLVQLVPMGDHGYFLAEVVALARQQEGEPLLYCRGRFHTLGGPAAPASWAPLERSDLAAER